MDQPSLDNPCAGRVLVLQNKRIFESTDQFLPNWKSAFMGNTSEKMETPSFTESDEVFESAAEVFRVMSAPMRLKIISSLCNGEKNVGELLREINTTQPNMSQHLNTLYQSGVLGKRRDGVQIFYRIVNDRVVTLCRAVCTQIAIETDNESR
jgi:DNA-binding transcriptional ArsR family regulator